MPDQDKKKPGKIAKPGGDPETHGGAIVAVQTENESVTGALSGGGSAAPQQHGMSGVMLMPQPYDLILPSEETRYLVTESQLGHLESMGRNLSLEWALFLLGAALGLFVNFIETVAALTTDQGPGAIGLLCSALFLLLLAFGTARLLEYRNTSTTASGIIVRIKRGPKLTVGTKSQFEDSNGNDKPA